MVKGTILILVVFLYGCSTPRIFVETQEVMVPVPYRVVPPDVLLNPYHPRDLPEFVEPENEEASSCLTPLGEKQLREMIIDLRLRDDLWRTWAQ